MGMKTFFPIPTIEVDLIYLGHGCSETGLYTFHFQLLCLESSVRFGDRSLIEVYYDEDRIAGSDGDSIRFGFFFFRFYLKVRQSKIDRLRSHYKRHEQENIH